MRRHSALTAQNTAHQAHSPDTPDSHLQRCHSPTRSMWQNELWLRPVSTVLLS